MEENGASHQTECSMVAQANWPSALEAEQVNPLPSDHSHASESQLQELSDTGSVQNSEKLETSALEDKEGSMEVRRCGVLEPDSGGGEGESSSCRTLPEGECSSPLPPSDPSLSLALKDGDKLLGESDVDVTTDSVTASGDVTQDNDISSLRDSSSFDSSKMISSSLGSMSSLGGVRKTSAASQNSATEASASAAQTQLDSTSGQRLPDAVSPSSHSAGKSGVEGGGVGGANSARKTAKTKSKPLTNNCHETDLSPTLNNCTHPEDRSVTVPPNGSGDACGQSNLKNRLNSCSEDNAAGNRDDNVNEAENLGSGGCSSSHEPFTSLVDMASYQQDFANGSAGGDQSGNAREQELRTLLESPGDSHCRRQLKKLLRSGAWGPGCSVRRVAWRLVCSYMYKLEKAHVYLQMEKEMFGDSEDEDVPVPVWPQQPSHEDPVLTSYYLTARGKNRAHKIVAVISQLSPDITYSPGLLPLVDLFLHYMEEEDCFSCALTLLQSRGLIYLTQSRVAFEASKRVLRDLTKKYAKSSYVALVRSCSNVDMVFDNWLWWIYSDLPFRHVVAVTDSYLLEGVKVLYRVVLAILMLFTKHSGLGKRGAPSVNIPQAVSDFCQEMPVTPATLLKVAFRIRGFSRHKIMKLQNRHEGLITSGVTSLRVDMPRIASSQSFGNLSAALSNAMSMTHANIKMMGLHNTGSNILTVDQLVTIWNWLPSRHSINQPVLLFNSADLGTSLMTLYAYVENEPCSIIIIKTIHGEVFGAFCGESWNERRSHCRPIRYFGTGETFLFNLVPERVKHEWVGKPDPHVPLSANMFQAGDNNCLMIGGGNGCGIQLDGMMERCRTETCDTFNNPPLCPSMDFTPAAIEVFGLQ